MTFHLCITPHFQTPRKKSVAIIPPERRCEIQTEDLGTVKMLQLWPSSEFPLKIFKYAPFQRDVIEMHSKTPEDVYDKLLDQIFVIKEHAQ